MSPSEMQYFALQHLLEINKASEAMDRDFLSSTTIS
jgi:hypothetical protein